ncbi:natural cytotoxicity triggering receptor 3 isoform X2 [Echinops telfairi]|uniref:Natural cytotoxicity triggering receptor 3 isoform X2 n=1 Tax=Echinops telfairi TaxID=9371 RepID=A0AC55DB13_ECHTE|nr:natural cytotoxicity triggering receptor 3 isoform X2 [Echinops telfairi]
MVLRKCLAKNRTNEWVSQRRASPLECHRGRHLSPTLLHKPRQPAHRRNARAFEDPGSSSGGSFSPEGSQHSVLEVPGSCSLWVTQPPEIRTREGTTAFLPCFFNATRGRPAIGFVTWYRDKVGPGKEVRNETPEFQGRLAPLGSARFLYDHQAELHITSTRPHDAGVYLCRVEVLGLGSGTGNGTWLVVEKGSYASLLLLRAAFYAFSFLSVAVVAVGCAFCDQGKGACHMGTGMSC